MDWVTENNTYRFIWRDDIKDKEDTPDGYIYVVGKNTKDILNYMGLTDDIIHEESSIFGTIPLNNSPGAIGWVNINITTNTKITVRIRYDKNSISENNRKGLIFTGIDINSTLVYTDYSQYDISVNARLITELNSNSKEAVFKRGTNSYTIVR